MNHTDIQGANRLTLPISSIMETLAHKRPVFHSEADFQLAFAWEIKARVPACEIRLEYAVPGLGYHLDVLVWLDAQMIPIELKYKTLRSQFAVNGEMFALKGHGAQDIGRYDIVKDIARIEQIVHELHCPAGYTVSLTNDPSYWIPANRATIADELRLTEGRLLTGELGWAAHAGAARMKGREQRLPLDGPFRLPPVDYPALLAARNRLFRYLHTPFL